MALRTVLALIAIAVGAVGLGLNFYVISSVMTVSPANPVARSAPDFLLYYLSFLTNLGNIALILVYLSDLTDGGWLGWFRQPVTRAGLAGLIALVMGFYHFMLAPTLTFLSGPIVLSNQLLHYVTPTLFLVWWLVYAGHGALRLRDVPAMLAPGLVYVAYILGRGALVGQYPYTVLDPGFAIDGAPQGYLGVATGIGVLVVIVTVFDALLVAVDGLIARRRQVA